jgi:hypothetical protein
MTGMVQWAITVDNFTDALVRSHLGKCRPEVTLDAFVERAIRREFDCLALEDAQRAAAPPSRSGDMWEIVIPLPKPR